MSDLEVFVKSQIEASIHYGNVLVSTENKKARLMKCDDCPHKGIVRPAPKIKGEGCKICECLLSTKAAMKTIMRVKGNVGKKLTPIELAKIAILIRVNPKALEKETITCPNPEVDMWQDVDNKFK